MDQELILEFSKKYEDRSRRGRCRRESLAATVFEFSNLCTCLRECRCAIKRVRGMEAPAERRLAAGVHMFAVPMQCVFCIYRRSSNYY